MLFAFHFLHALPSLLTCLAEMFQSGELKELLERELNS